MDTILSPNQKFINHLKLNPNTPISEVIKRLEQTKPINDTTQTITKPTHITKGDVFIYKAGEKTRPVVVIKTDDQKVFALALTTTDNCLAMSKYTSRFFKSGFFTPNLICVPHEYAKDKFVGVFDNNRCLNNAIKLFKEIANNL